MDPARTDSLTADPADRARAHRVFLGNLVVNTLLALAKICVGWIARSPALLADGWHSTGDVLTGSALWVAYGASQKPPDEDHHYGHGNFEALGGLLAGLLIGVGGIAVVWSALAADVLESRGGPAALVMALVSVFGNLWLVKLTRSAGRELRSPILTSVARDNAGDVGTGVLVFVGVGCTALGWPIAERFVAVLIGALVVRLGWSSAKEGFDVLMDRVDDPDAVRTIEAAALGVEGVRGVQAIRVHPIGSAYRVDLEIAVAGDRTVQEGHAIAHAAESAITRRAPRVVEVHVHVNPAPARDAASPGATGSPGAADPPDPSGRTGASTPEPARPD